MKKSTGGFLGFHSILMWIFLCTMLTSLAEPVFNFELVAPGTKRIRLTSVELDKGQTEVVITNPLNIGGTNYVVEELGEYLFANNWDLESVTLPETGLKKIGKYAFYSCGIQSITIPSTVTELGIYAFSETSIHSITLPNTISSIPEGLCQNCWNLKNITFPQSLTSIGDYAFQNCSDLTTVTLPNSLNYMGAYVFDNIRELTELVIPPSLNIIKNHAFEYSYNLKTIWFKGNFPDINVAKFDEEVLFSPETTVYGYRNKTGWTSLFGTQAYGSKMIKEYLQPAPVISKNGTGPGFTETATISITAPYTLPQGTAIFFTTDGTEPDNSSSSYTEPFEISATNEIKAAVLYTEDTIPYSFTSISTFYKVEEGTWSFSEANNTFTFTSSTSSINVEPDKDSESRNIMKIIPDAGLTGTGNALAIDIPQNHDLGDWFSYYPAIQIQEPGWLTFFAKLDVEPDTEGKYGEPDFYFDSWNNRCPNNAEWNFFSCYVQEEQNLTITYSQGGDNTWGRAYIDQMKFIPGTTLLTVPDEWSETDNPYIAEAQGSTILVPHGFTGAAATSQISFKSNANWISAVKDEDNITVTVAPNQEDERCALLSVYLDNTILIGKICILQWGSQPTPETMFTTGYLDAENKTLAVTGMDSECPYKLITIPPVFTIDEIEYTVTALKQTSPSSTTSPFQGIELLGIKLPDTVTSINQYFFSYCNNLRELSGTESITTVGQNAFQNCQELKSLNLPALTNIPTYTFYGCSSLEELNLQSAQVINNFAFYGMSSIVEMNLPSAEEIYSGSFTGCSSLKILRLGKNMRQFNSSPFDSSGALAHIYFDGPVPSYTYNRTFNSNITLHVWSDLGWSMNYSFAGSKSPLADRWDEGTTSGDFKYLLRNDGSDILYITGYTGEDKVLTLPAELDGKVPTAIAPKAFSQNTNITELIIPENYTLLATGAFSGCTALNKITFLGDFPQVNGTTFNSVTDLYGYSSRNGWEERFGTAPYGCRNILKIWAIPTAPAISRTDSQMWKTFLSSLELEITATLDEGQQIFYTIDGSAPSPSSPEYTAPFTISSTATVKTAIFNSEGEQLSPQAQATFFRTGTDPAAWMADGTTFTYSNPGLPDIVLTTDDTNPWVLQNQETANGSPAPGSKRLTQYNTSSTIHTQLEGKGVLNFLWKVTCKENDATFKVFLDDIEAASITGWTDWSMFSIHIKEEGTHTVTWTFESKVTGTPKDDNTAYLDNVVFQPWALAFTPEDFTVSCKGDSQLALDIDSALPFTIKTDSEWITPGQLQDNTLQFSVEPNKKDTLLKGNIILDSGTVQAFFPVLQEPAPASQHYFTFSTDNENKTAIITGYEGNLEYLTVPETVILDNQEYTVIGIAARVFQYDTSIKVISLPDTITSLGDYAFSSASALQKANLGNGLLTIGDYAFQSSQSLTEVNVGTSLQSLGQYAFNSCNKLKGITLPATLESLGTNVFNGCTSLESAALPSSITEIPAYTFSGCNNLKNIVIHNTVTSIGTNAFVNCYSLKSVNIPDSVKSIMNNAFSYCITLEEITVPSTVTTMGTYVFSYCSSLKTADVSGLTSLNTSIFQNCTALETVILSNQLTTINANAFNGCSSLSNVTFPATLTTIGNYAFQGTGFTSLDWPTSVTSFGDYAFASCKKLTNVTFSTEQPVLPNYGLMGCTALESFTFPAGLTSLPNGFLRDCTLLNNVVLPPALQTLPQETFYGCTALQSITLPESVTTLGNNVFRNCTSLSSITIPHNLTSIGEYAFSYCRQITQLQLPNTVTSIGKYAFNYTSLEFFNWPESITTITEYAFYDCEELKYINIPDTVKRINSSAFYYCSNLSSITLPPIIESIASNAFSYCSKLNTVFFAGASPDINSYAFNSCSNLKTVIFTAGTPPGTSTLFNSSPIFYVDPDQPGWQQNIGKKYRGASNVIARNNQPPAGDWTDLGNNTLHISNNGFGTLFLTTPVASTPWTISTVVDETPAALTPANTAQTYPFTSATAVTVTGPGSIYFEYMYPSQEGNSTAAFNGTQLEPSPDSFTPYSMFIADGEQTLTWNFTQSQANTGEDDFLALSKVIWIPIIRDFDELIIPAETDESFTISVSTMQDFTLDEAAVSPWLHAVQSGSTITITPENNTSNTIRYGQLFILIDGLSFQIGTAVQMPTQGNDSDYTFSYDDENTAATITGYTGTDKYLVLPAVTTKDDTVYTVTKIAPSVFVNKNELKSVVFPASLTHIGDSAFANCSRLESPVFPDSLLTIGDMAFQNCSAFTAVETSAQNIGAKAFYGCPGIKTITLKEGVVNIGAYAFAGTSSKKQTNLTSVTFPASLRTIGDQAFRYCTALTSLTFQEGLTHIGSSDNEGTEDGLVFADCSILESVTLPSTLLRLGAGTFSECKALASVTIPKNAQLTAIRKKAFYKCQKLTAFNTPDTVTNIGEQAFYYCSAITQVPLPSGLTDIGTQAFDQCSKLANITIPTGLLRLGEKAFNYCSSLTEITVPASLEVFGNNAFENCSKLVTATLQEGLARIPDYAFSYCSALTTVNLPSTLTYIGTYAFRNTAITGAVIPAKVTAINAYTFYSCSKLVTLQLHDDITVLKNNCFQSCSSLESVTLPDKLISIESYAFDSCKKLTSVTFNSKLENIGQYAFRYCGFESVNLPSSLKTLGSYAFNSCPNLTSFKVPYLTGNTCGSYLLAYCSNLRTITFDDNITVIPDNLAYSCSELKYVTIPASVTTIQNYAFRSCSALDYIVFDGNRPTVSSSTFSSNTELQVDAATYTLWAEKLGQTYGGAGNVVPRLAQSPAITGEDNATSFDDSLEVTITAIYDPETQVLRYSTDGEVNAESPAYTEPLVITGNTTVSAAVFTLEGVKISNIGTAVFSKNLLPTTWFISGQSQEGSLFTFQGADNRAINAFTPAPQKWFLQNQTVYSSDYALRSPLNYGSGVTSSVQIPLNGTGFLSFFWKLTGNSSYTALTLTVDGVEITSIRNNTDWTQVSAPVTGDGEHLAEITFISTSTYTSTDYVAFLDAFSWYTAELDVEGNDTISGDSAEYQLQVTTSMGWNVESSNEWITITSPQGRANGNGVITYTVQENTTNYEREGNIRINIKDQLLGDADVFRDFPITQQRQIMQINLSAAEDGTGSFTINDQEATYAELFTGEYFYITAIPAENYVFDKWTEGENTYTSITLNRTAGYRASKVYNYIATFLPKVTLVKGEPVGGSFTVSNNSGQTTLDFAAGQQITLSASAANNYKFDHWEIDGQTLEGTSYCTITCTADMDGKTIVPIFTQRIHVSAQCYYLNDDGVTWTQDNNIANISGTGNIDILPGGTNAVLEAANIRNTYTFLGWNSSLSMENINPDNPGYIGVTWSASGSITVYALFAKKSIVKSGYASGSAKSMGTYTILYGTQELDNELLESTGIELPASSELTLTAAPAQNCAVKYWQCTSNNYTVNNPSATVQVTISSGENIFKIAFARYAEYSVTLSPEAPAGAYIDKVEIGGSKVANSGTVEVGTNITYTAVPPRNYRVQWLRNGTEVGSGSTFTAAVQENSENNRYTAAFVPTYTLVLKAVPESGAATFTFTSKAFDVGTEASFSCNPINNYRLIRWSDDVTESSRTYTGTEQGTVELTAYLNVFSTISASYDQYAGGASFRGTGYYTVPEGGNSYTATVTAVPGDNYRFGEWTDTDARANLGENISNPERKVTINAGNLNINLTASLVRVYNVTFDVKQGCENLGSVDNPLSGIKMDAGSNVTVTAVPAAGSQFTKWSDGITEPTRTFENLNRDITLYAEFRAESFIRITIPEDQTGLGTAGVLVDNNLVPEGNNFLAGQRYTIEARPAENSRFLNWSDGNTTANRSMVLPPEGIELSANFQRTGQLRIDLLRTPEELPAGVPVPSQKWRIVGNGSWRNSGDTVTLPIGDYTIEYYTTGDWVKPETEQITVAHGDSLSLERTFTRITHGKLTGYVAPNTLTDAKWKVMPKGDYPGTDWLKTNQMIDQVPEGEQIVTFSDNIPGWIKPDDITVNIMPNRNVSFNASYTEIVPGVEITFEPAEVSEAAGVNAAIATVRRVDMGERNPVNLNKTITVHISASEQRALLLPASSIVIPAGKEFTQFPVGVVNNTIMEDFIYDSGNNPIARGRKVFLSGKVAMSPGCNCSGTKSYGSDEEIQAALVIWDDDSPALKITANPATMAESENIYRNAVTFTRNDETPGGELPIRITALIDGAEADEEIQIFDSEDNQLFPDEEGYYSAVIPAAQPSVSLGVKVIPDDKVESSSQIVSFYADAESYAPGTTWVMLSDLSFPDYTVETVVTPSTLKSDCSYEVTGTIANTGNVAAPAGTELQIAVYLTRASSLKDEDRLSPNDQQENQKYHTIILEEPLEKGGKLDFALPVTLENVAPLNTWKFGLKVNPDSLLREVNTLNNTAWSGTFPVDAAYCVQLDNIPEGTYILQGDMMTLTGTVFQAENDLTPMADKKLELFTVINGIRSVLTDSLACGADGRFTYLYDTKVNSMTGIISLGACYPGADTIETPEKFDVLALNYATETKDRWLLWEVDHGTSKNFSFTLKNPNFIKQAGITAEILNGSEDMNVTFNSVPDELEGGASALVELSITADAPSTLNGFERPVLRITSNEGTVLDIPVYYHAYPKYANLLLEPAKIDTTMQYDFETGTGVKRTVEVVITNNGKQETGTITASLPNVSWLSFTYGSTIQSIPQGESASLFLDVTADENTPIGAPVSGKIALNAPNLENGVLLPFTFTATSEAKGGVNVFVMDENYYYEEAKPGVANANVTIKNPYTGNVLAKGTTDEHGYFTAEDLPVGRCLVAVSAPQHESVQQYVDVSPGINTLLEIFSGFQAISIDWDVVRTEIEDHYEVVLNVTYAVNVPVPVVKLIVRTDYTDMQPGDKIMENAILVNEGLIRANNLRLDFGSTDEYIFTVQQNDDGASLDAGGVLTLPVIIERKNMAATRSGECGTWCATVYNYECGLDMRWHKFTKDVTFDRICNTGGKGFYYTGVSVGGGGGPAYGGGGGGGAVASGGSVPPPPASDPSCIPCINGFFKQLFHCALGFVPIIGCIDGVASGAKDMYNNLVNGASLLTWARSAGGLALALWGCVPGIQQLKAVVNCVYNILANSCGSLGGTPPATPPPALQDPGSNTRGVRKVMLYSIPASSTANTPAWVLEIKRRLTPVYWYLHYYAVYMEELFGSDIWLDSQMDQLNNFRIALNKVHIQGPDGHFIPIQENDETLRTALPENISIEDMNIFIRRFNRTMAYIEAGSGLNDFDYATRGDDSVINIAALARYNEGMMKSIELAGEVNDGNIDMADITNNCLEYAESMGQSSTSVCAQVTLEIKQKISMTREAFDGTLTMTNGHQSLPITAIGLVPKVTDAAGNDCTDLFEVFEAEDARDGITALDGTGTLDAKTTGSAVIRFIPENSAAPEVPVPYNFGGTLTYINPFSGQVASIELTPCTLTVNPSPKIQMHYFLQRDVIGDDPLTAAIEPSRPAELSVLVYNDGFGTAKNFRIDSGQPTIVDNRKGLAIDMSLWDYGTDMAMLNGSPNDMPLGQVNLGNIEPKRSALAQWWLTSSLLGHFTDMKASYTHLDSNGNPDISLIDSVAIHPLIHSGKTLDGTETIFLTSDPISEHGSQNGTIYFSNDARTSYSMGNYSFISGHRPALQSTGGRYYLTFQLRASNTCWYHVAEDDPGRGEYQVVSWQRRNMDTGETVSLPVDNIWFTNCTLVFGNDPLYEDKLHFLDDLEQDATYEYTAELKPLSSTPLKVTAFNGTSTLGEDLNNYIISGNIHQIAITFSEPIDPDSLDATDIRIRKGANFLPVNQVNSNLIISRDENDETGKTYILAGLGALVNQDAYYVLQVQCADITNLTGTPGRDGQSIAWVHYTDFQTEIAPTLAYMRKVYPEAGLDGEFDVELGFDGDIDFSTMEDLAPFKLVRHLANGSTETTTLRNYLDEHNTSGVRILRGQLPGEYRIKELGSIAEEHVSFYTMEFNAADVTDILGNPSAGQAEINWSNDHTPPDSPSTTLSPDTGVQGDFITANTAVDEDGQLMFTLTGQFQENNVSFRLYSVNGKDLLPVTELMTADETGFTVDFTTPPQDGSYSFVLRMSDIMDNSADYPFTVTVDNTAPVIESCKFNGSDNLQHLVIPGTYPVTAQVKENGIPTVSVNGVPAAQSGQIYRTDLPLSENGEQTVLVTVTDEAGNSAEHSFLVTVDAVPLDFEELYINGEQVLPGSIPVVRTFTFTLSGKLSKNAVLRIEDDVTALGGDFTFTKEITVDEEGPQLISIYAEDRVGRTAQTSLNLEIRVNDIISPDFAIIPGWNPIFLPFESVTDGTVAALANTVCYRFDLNSKVLVRCNTVPLQTPVWCFTRETIIPRGKFAGTAPELQDGWNFTGFPEDTENTFQSVFQWDGNSFVPVTDDVLKAGYSYFIFK